MTFKKYILELKSPESYLGDEHEEDVIQIGDRVIAMYAVSGNESVLYKKGTVISKHRYAEKPMYSVQFDKKIVGGHAGYIGNGKPGYCWNIPEYYLKRISFLGKN